MNMNGAFYRFVMLLSLFQNKGQNALSDSD